MGRRSSRAAVPLFAHVRKTRTLTKEGVGMSVLKLMAVLLKTLPLYVWLGFIVGCFMNVYSLDKHGFSTRDLAAAHLMMVWLGSNITAMLIYFASR